MTRRRIIRILAAALAATSLGAPAAHAMPDYPTTSPSASESTAADTSTATPTPVSVPGPTVVVEADEGSSFDWGSAAIGAGVAAAIVLLGGVGATTAVRHGRFRTGPAH